MKRSLLLCLLFLIPVASYSGPFGLEMGMPLAELSKVTTLKLEAPFIYSTPRVPKLHPDFDNYLLKVTPDHGLCKIVTSTMVKTSAYGTEIIEKFNSLDGALTTKYGTPERLDFLKVGSIWGEPRFWMMGLYKNERILMSSWEKDLPDNLASIDLSANSLGLDMALVRISYNFKNVGPCTKWIKSQQNSAL
jgi:hypothetical protein